MRTSQIALALLIYGLAAQSVNAQVPSETILSRTKPQGEPRAEQNKAEKLLQHGLYLSDLYNWAAARPYLAEAKQLLQASTGKRNALYAELAVIRAGGERAPLPELSYRLAQQLATNPILQSDKELRMFCFVVKGELDGEIDSATMRRDWNEVSTLAQQTGNAKWQYRAQGQLGFADFYDGDLPGAQKNVAEALIGATTINDVGGQIFYLSATAEGLVGQGMNEQALQYATRAIALADATPDAGYPIIAEKARLIALVQMGDTAKAKAELGKALAQAKRERSYAQMADLNATAGQIARIEKKIPSAIAYLTEALRDASQVDGRKVIAGFQSEISDLYRLTGNLEKAQEFANDAAISAQRFGLVPMIPRSLQALADTQIAQHKYMEADQTLDRAGAVQDAMIETADSDLGKRALIKGANNLYAKHFALIAEHSDNKAKAFSVVEQARGRVMADLLMSGSKTSPDAIADERKIAQLRLRLMTATSIPEVDRLREAIFLAEQSRSIIPQISILKSKEHRTITLTQLQHNLTPSEAVLEYVVDDPASYCFVITRTQYRIVKLPGRQTISPAVAAYLKEVNAKRAARSEAHKLYEILLRPIPESVSQERLVIIRDGPLHLVPFDALVSADNQYVVESHIVSYAPSATTFFLLRTLVRPQDQPHGVVAVGGIPYNHSGLKQSAVTRGFSDSGLSDLPTSEEEARAAVEALPDPSNVLLVGDEATETAFKKSINHRVIHLAVHAIANPEQPDRAALVLLSDPSNGEDGFLETSEIVQLQLNADLVVLSACNTAVGPIEGEEGIATLARSFLLAGARTVVSTLWPIEDDTTRYLMKSFYVSLARSKSAPEALRVAKKKMLETFGSDQALPYYWAGFTVEGLAAPPAEH